MLPKDEEPPLYRPELLEPKRKLTLLQHCYKEPWVPIGALITTGALCSGLAGFVAGDSQHMQRMMRLRVVAQGATVLSMCVGVAMAARKRALKEPVGPTPILEK